MAALAAKESKEACKEDGDCDWVEIQFDDGDEGGQSLERLASTECMHDDPKHPPTGFTHEEWTRARDRLWDYGRPFRSTREPRMNLYSLALAMNMSQDVYLTQLDWMSSRSGKIMEHTCCRFRVERVLTLITREYDTHRDLVRTRPSLRSSSPRAWKQTPWSRTAQRRYLSTGLQESGGGRCL